MVSVREVVRRWRRSVVDKRQSVNSRPEVVQVDWPAP